MYWSKLLPPRLALKDIIILVVLLLGGAIANYFPLNLSLGVDFLFGGIAVWLVVILYGTYWGTLAALMTSLVTIRLWGHPYAVIIFTLETFFVASLWHSRRRNLLLLDVIYWLCLGMPLIGLFYGWVMQLSPLQVGLIALKQPLNGIFQVLIANLVVFFLPIHHWTRRSRQIPSESFRQILFNLLFVLAIIPLLPLVSLKGHLAFQQLKNRVDRDLTAISTAVKTEINREQQERLTDLEKLVRVAQTSGLQQSAQLQQSTEFFQKNQPVWQQLYVTNSKGEVIASSPPLDTANGANAIEPTACNVKERFTFVPATGSLQIKFPVLRAGESSPGCVVGEIDTNYLRQLLLANRSNSELGFSLVDGDRVVVSTDEPKEELAPQTNPTPINNTFLNSTIEHRLPIDNNMPRLARWQGSSFLQRQSLDYNFPLTLVIETPAEPYINLLQQIYVLTLVQILFIAVLAWFFSYLLSRQLVNPLSRLAVVTSDLPDKLSENKHIAWPGSRIAEVQSLSRNFQLMAEILQEKFQELQTINTTLEKRIENRTQELSRSNQDLQAEVAQRKQTETSLRQTTRTLKKFTASLEQLHRISTTQYDSLEKLFAECLEIGRDILTLKTGMIGEVSDRSYIIRSVRSDLTCLKPGLALSLENTYCKAVVESQKTITYDRVGEIAVMENHPLYRELMIESYISTPIFINEKIYGTLCFCSTEVRSNNFDDREQKIVELMAKTIGWYISDHQGQEKLKRQYRRSQLLSEVAFKIRQSLQLEEILEITVTEVQKLLQSERVAIVHCDSDGSREVVKEAVASGFPSLRERSISELVFIDTYLKEFRQGCFVAISENLIDTKTVTVESNDRQLLEFGVQASLGVPIFITNQFWGLLLLQHFSNPRRWKDFEIELSQQLVNQIGIALSQSQLLQNLEELVAQRTVELSQTNERLQRELLERQRVEKALRESETRLAMAHRVARIGSWEFDLESQKIAWSAETFRHWGLAPTDSEPTYAELFQRVHPDDREMLQQSIERAIAEGISYSFDLRVLRPDGSIGYLESRGKPIVNDRGQTVKLVGTSLDISDRKQTEQQLRFARQRLSHLLTASPAIIYSCEPTDVYSITFVSDNIISMLGYDSNQFTQTADFWSKHLHPEDKSRIFADLSQVYERKHLIVEYRFQHKDGTYRWLRDEMKIVYDERGEALEIVGCMIDISERKQAEEALIQSETRLRQLVELNLIGVMFWDIDGSILDANDAFLKMVDYTREDLQEGRLNWRSLTPVEQLPLCEKSLQKMQQHLCEIVEKEYIRKDGSRVPIMLGGVMFADSQSLGVSFVIDLTERKRAEETLRASEERFKAQYRGIPIPTYTWQQRGEEFVLIEYNRAAEIYTQGKISQILGKRASRLYADTPEILATFSQCLNERTSIKREMHYQMRSTGEWKDLIVNYAFVPPDMIIVHTEDITTIKEIETELKAKNAEMEAIFAAFPDLFFRVSGDGTILDYKAQRTSKLYLQPEFLIGKSIREVLPLTAGKQCEKMISRVLETNSLASFEYTLSLVNTEKYYEARLVPLQSDRAIIIVRDISDRKRIQKQRQRAEETLRRSEKQLRLIANALPISIAYVDAQQCYLFTNQAYKQWFGRKPWELKGLTLQTVMGLSVYQQVREYVEIVLSGQRVDFEMEVPALDGNYHCLNVTYIPHLAEREQVKGFFVSMVDITERKAVERMKEEFLSVVSHELRTPVTAIHGSLKLLATGMLGQLSQRGSQMLDIADESCDRLVRLIDDLLNFQRMNSGRVTLRQQNYNTATLVIKAVQAMQEMARQQNIILSTEPISISVWVDPDYILQVLSNLIGNAIKFSDPGTTIWLQVRERAEEILFEVRDEGRGIPPDKLESIFERFHQVDASDSRQKGGTGLGLAICRQIIDLHGGKIWVESTLGRGSTFYFTLPRIN